MKPGARHEPTLHPVMDELDLEIAFEYDRLLDAFSAGIIAGPDIGHSEGAFLLTLLAALGWSPDARELAGALPHFAGVFGSKEVRTTLIRLGYWSQTRKIGGAELSVLRSPAIVIDTDDRMYLVTQSGREARLGRIDLVGDWHFESISPRRMYQTIEISGASANSVGGLGAERARDVLRRFAPEFRFALLISVLSGCISVAGALGIIVIFDNVLPSGNTSTLAWLVAGFAALFIFEFLLKSLAGRAISRTSARIEYIFGTALFEKILRLPENLLSGASIGAQLARLKQFQAVRELPSGGIAQVIFGLPLAIISLLAIAFFAWPLALLVTVCILAVCVGMLVLVRPLRATSARLLKEHSTAYRLIQQTAIDRKQIARMGMSDVWKKQVNLALRDLALARMEHGRAMAITTGVSQLGLPLTMLVVVGFGAALAIQGAITTGQLVATTILTSRILTVPQQLSMQMSRVLDVRETLQQIDLLRELPVRAETGSYIAPARLRQAPLRLHNVTFRYPRAIGPVIFGANYELRSGSLVAIIGQSGSGKSTLLRLMSGVVAPQSGAVWIGERNIGQLSGRSRAQIFAYVSQRPFLFYGTVAQNMRFADPMATDEKLEAHIHELGLGAWLENLPQGLSTRIDPSSDESLLPSDIRMSFSIARALLSDPAILLLDEPVGRLDSTLEARMMAAIERRRGWMTTVLVTHRPSIARRADEILRIDRGRLGVLKAPDGEEQKVAS